METYVVTTPKLKVELYAGGGFHMAWFFKNAHSLKTFKYQRPDAVFTEKTLEPPAKK